MPLRPPSPRLRRWLLLLAAACLPGWTPARAGEAVSVETNGKAVPVYSLEDCVRLARQQSPEVLQAAKQLDASRALITSAKAGFLPQVGANGTYLKREASSVRGSPGNENRRAEDYTVSGRVTQNLFSSGRVRAQVDIAKRTFTVQEMSFRQTLETVTLAVRTAFFQVLQAEANVGVRQQALELLGQQVRDEQNRFQAGQSSQINVQRVQVNLANEQPQLLSAQNDIAAGYVALAQAMGVPYPPGRTSPPFRIRGTLDYLPRPPSLEACLARAESQRPELASRRLEILNANRQVTVDAAETRPRVDVLAGYDVFSETSTLATRDYYSGYTVGVQGTWQIFNGFATLGRVRADRARIVAASEQLRQTRLQVQGEVRLAYESLQQAESTLRSQGNTIGLAQETLGLITTNVGAGLASQLEQLQARLDLTRTQITRFSSLFNYRTALARLDRAMGETAPADAPLAGNNGAPVTSAK